MLGIRADRAASLYFFRPVNRLRRARPGVPILMYHRVPERDDCAKHPYYCTSTAAVDFASQMRFLHEKGYRTVSVMEAFRQSQAASAREKVVAITFDDGYRDFYTNAFPILNRYGYSATVFLPTAYIGNSPISFKGSECLTWSQVRELRRERIEFGSHTMTHPQLRDVNTEELRREVVESKSEIEARLGEAVDAFSYPYAFPEADRNFVGRLEDVLRGASYRSGVSTRIGRADSSDNLLFLRRLPVNSHDDERFFASKLEGGYDWLGNVQYAAKLRHRGRMVQVEAAQ